jgi:uncharacterized membrane protein
MSEEAQPLNLVMPGRSLSAGSGWSWIRGGWSFFTAAPLMWIVFMIVLVVCSLVVQFIPIVGSFAWQVISPAISAGLVIGCRSLETSGELELEHLVAGFKTHFGQLIVLGLLYVLGGLIILGVMAACVGTAIVMAVLNGDADALMQAFAITTPLLVGGFISLILAALLLASYWFAPALVVMHGMAPSKAMLASLGATFRNVGPFLVYGLVMFFFLMLALLPFGLGMLIWVPVTIASGYFSYREVFTEGK